MPDETPPPRKSPPLQTILPVIVVIAAGWRFYYHLSRDKQEDAFQKRMAENGERLADAQQQERVARGMALPEPDRSDALKVGGEFLKRLRSGDFAAAATLVTASQREKLDAAALKKFVEDHPALKTEGACTVTMVLSYTNPFGASPSPPPTGGDFPVPGIPRLPRQALEMVQVEKGEAASDAPLAVMISVSNRMLSWEIGNCEVPLSVQQ